MMTYGRVIINRVVSCRGGMKKKIPLDSDRSLRIVVFFCFLCLGYLACDILLNSDDYIWKRRRGIQIPDAYPVPELAEWNSEGQSEFILDTPFCRIPRTPIFPNVFRGYWKRENIPNCSYEKLLGKISSNGKKFQLLPEYHHQNCTAAEVLRMPSRDDNSYALSNWTRLENELDLGDWELFVIKCGTFLNFDARLPIVSSTQVKKKLEFWADEFRSPLPKPSSPINVILLGVDNVSRSHALRSLPKTISLFQEMGFHDFQGYHSIFPSTLTNSMGFLMGLQRTTVRATCSPNWESPFDSCPLIWKNYSAQNYVTMYIEDGFQTFNWAGQSGFEERPTDYYPHHLFTAIREMRSNQADKDAPCTSSETVPQFVGRYTKEFLETFSDVPFFTYIWYNDPTHEFPFTLQTLDDELLRLYKFINSSPHLLQNSLLIFLSDHGDRVGFLRKAVAEGFIERGLPPFFIRIPEKLVQMYPGMRLGEVMEQNSHQLVSPFDLHHTLLHLLTLSRRESSMEDVQPIMKDRRSLFVSLADRNGTCENLNILSESCVCNTLTKSESFPFDLDMKNIGGILEKKLNHLVESQGYSDKCEKWKVQKLIKNRLLRKTNSSLDILIRFRAKPGRAYFEVTAQVNIGKKTDSWKIKDFLRISTYGNEGVCIPVVTDLDKDMKGFCYCKNQTII